MKRLNKLHLATVALLVVVAVLNFSDFRILEPVDYCQEEKRVLPDSEFKRASFNLLVLQRRDESVNVGDPDKKKVKTYDIYYSQWAPDFNVDNCCVVRRENSIWRRFWRTQKTVVEISPDTKPPREMIYENTFDVCGYVEILQLGFPMSVTKPIKTSDERLRDENIRLEGNWDKRDY
jgi:hypothetical protein